MVGAEFYDEYNVTWNATGFVADSSGGSSMGLMEQNRLWKPQWSSIFRPPTDQICMSKSATSLVEDGICPQPSAMLQQGRKIVNRIGENRGYAQVAQEGLEMTNRFCVYGWAQGNPSTCILPFAHGPTLEEDLQGFRGSPIWQADPCQDWCQSWIVDPDKNTSVPVVVWNAISDPCDGNWYGVTCETDASPQAGEGNSTVTDLWLYANGLGVRRLTRS